MYKRGNEMKKNAVRDLILNIEAEIGFYANVTLTRLIVKQGVGEWLMVISVLDRTGLPKVAFIDGHSIFSCYEQLASALYTTSISLSWHIDKFYSP